MYQTLIAKFETRHRDLLQENSELLRLVFGVYDYCNSLILYYICANRCDFVTCFCTSIN